MTTGRPRSDEAVDRSPSARSAAAAGGQRRAAPHLPTRILVRKARRDLRRQATQFVAVAVAVLLGVALFVASFDAFHNLQDSYGQTYRRLAFADLTVTGGDVGALARQASSAPGVAAAVTRTQADVPMIVAGTELYGRVVGLPAAGQPAVDRVGVTDGTYLRPDRPDGVLLERHAADHFHLGPGATVTAGGRTLQVLGVVDSAEYLWPARSRQDTVTDPDSFAVVFAPEALARQLAGTDAPNQALVLLTPAGRRGDALASVEAQARRAGASDVATRAEQPSNSTLQEDISGFEELSIAFPALFLTAAAIAAYVVLTRRVLGEKPVIAMLLAGGARRGPVVLHYLVEGLAAGLTGAVPGVVLGVAATTAITRAYTGAIGVPDTVVAHQPLSLVVGVAFGVVVGVLGAAAPALAASRTAPAEAMRGVHAASAAGRPGPWSRLVSAARWLPASVRMALRDVGRSRRRTLATVVGVVLALVLVLSSGGMVDTVRARLDLQFDQITRDDAEVVVPAGQQGALLDRARALPGVSAAEPAVTGPVTIGSGSRTYATSVVGFAPGTSMHRFHRSGGGWIDLPRRGVLAGEAVASRLHVRVGDPVTLRASDGTTTTVPLAGLLDEPFGTYVYADRSVAATALGSSPSTASLVLARFSPGADRHALRRRISALPGAVAYTDTQALQQQVGQYLGLFWVFIGVMTVLGGVLAFVAIFVTMTVNVAERTTELATLRAAGVPLRRIAGVLAVGNLASTLLGVPFGLVAGYLSARWFMQSFSSDMFRFDLSLSWPTVLLSVVAVLGAAVVSQLPAIRSLRRIDVARVVRERAA